MKNKTYVIPDGVMKNYIKKSDKLIKWEHYINETERNKIYDLLRYRFKNKSNFDMEDSIFYNFIRSKPLFKGINEIRENNFNFCKHSIECYGTFHYCDTSLKKEIEELIGSNKYKNILSIFFEKMKENLKKDTTLLKIFNK